MVPPGAWLFAALTAWVAVDAARRRRNWFGWAGLVALTGVVGLIPWLAVRRRPRTVVEPLGLRGTLAVLVTAFPLLLLPVLLALVVPSFLVQPARVDGNAMAPTLVSGDRLMVNKLAYRGHRPRRGDIVMLYYPLNPEKAFVMRVVATEGDQVRLAGGRVHLNDVELEEPFVAAEFRNDQNWGPQVIPEGYYFVMGDRRNNSSDSRHWGFVPRKYIVGRVQARWWPLSTARTF
jgi:signal peptidase I